MRRTSIVSVAALFIISAISSSAEQSASSKKPPKIVSLSGCLERDEIAPDQFTVTDPQAGGRYRVSGKDFREYVGRHVQLDGGVVVKGFVIKGGLQPTANIAAQAGALDPSRAAVQAQTQPAPTRPADNDPLPEFRVKKIQATAGGCEG